jgi:molecular chaperone GrpE
VGLNLPGFASFLFGWRLVTGMSQDASDAEPDEDSAGAGTADDTEGHAEAADDTDEAETAVDLELVERVEAADAESLAREIEQLRSEIGTLASQLDSREEEIDELESRLARKQADFQNFKKRQEKRTEEIRERATEDLIERLLGVRDNLERALDQDEDADIRGGIESTLAQFDQELERENVAVIEPASGEETDPTRHEVLMQVDSDQPEGTIDAVHRPGYEMADKVLRPAQVTVSDGSAADADESSDDSEDE